MHLSRYLKQYPCRVNPERILLFSTRRLSKAVVSRTLLGAVARGSLTEVQRATLARSGFLLEGPARERREMCTVFAEAEPGNRR